MPGERTTIRELARLSGLSVKTISTYRTRLLMKLQMRGKETGFFYDLKTLDIIDHWDNPFTGETYKEALHMSRIGREMICLMEGRHVHPSTIYPGGVGTVATPTLFTDYLTRLLRCLDFIKKAVAMNDDVFDFFYEALPGYEEVGRRRILLGCWGAFNNPLHVDYDYRNMDSWGRAMYVTPGVVVDGELVTTSLVDINLGLRILLTPFDTYASMTHTLPFEDWSEPGDEMPPGATTVWKLA